jgi:hypothetical protein
VPASLQIPVALVIQFIHERFRRLLLVERIASTQDERWSIDVRLATLPLFERK